MLSLRVLAAVLVTGLLSLTACSGASDVLNEAGNILEDVARDATSPDDGPDADSGVAVLTVSNRTESPICNLRVMDHDEPDAPGYSLLAEGEQLAPGAERTFPAGDHPLTDDHNLKVEAVSCDGVNYDEYHFSYLTGGGDFAIYPPLE